MFVLASGLMVKQKNYCKNIVIGIGLLAPRQFAKVYICF